MTTGAKCKGSGLGGLIFAMVLFAIMSILFVALLSMGGLVLGFMFGVVFDRLSAWLLSQAGNCK